VLFFLSTSGTSNLSFPGTTPTLFFLSKIPAAQARLFKNVFVCKSCGQKMRTDALKVLAKKIKCRRCGKRNFRPIKAKKK